MNNKKHYIIGPVYTYDLDFWVNIASDPDKVPLNVSSNYEENKLFIGNTPIEKINNNIFSIAIKKCCIIKDYRPEEPISLEDKYELLVYGYHHPGFMLARKPYKKYKRGKTTFITGDSKFYPYSEKEALGIAKEFIELIDKQKVDKVKRLHRYLNEKVGANIHIGLLAGCFLSHFPNFSRNTQDEWRDTLEIFKDIIKDCKKNKKPYYNKGKCYNLPQYK